MCDHRVVLHRCVVREWCTPSGSAVAPCLHAAARTRRAARAVKGDVLSVWQVLHETPSAPPIPAQRVARFDDHCTRNCLLQNKLRQRYSRCIEPEGERIAVVMIIPPPQPHRGAQRPGEGGELNIAPQATERLAPEILADHRPIGRGTGIAQREQDHVGQEQAATVPGRGLQGEGGRPRPGRPP